MDDQSSKTPEAASEAQKEAPAKKPKGKYVLLVGLIFLMAGCFMAYRPDVKPTVVVKDRAIDWEFPVSETEKSSLSALWKKGPLVVIWLRHFG
ncbi:MAG: hypothetical protein P1V97_20305 [Planctomycetota bacterium]|nr:hypothetical protein [Planctomycetota bacterium]